MSYANYHSRKLPAGVRYAADLFRFRHLCWNLVGSDLRSRFRRSHLGILWAIIQPLGYSLVIAWAWGAIFHMANYWAFAVYVYSGMLVWEYFGTVVNVSMDGLVNAVGYIKQARIPLFVFQLRVPLTGMVTFLFGAVGLAIMMLALQLLGLVQIPAPGLHLLLLPAFLGIMLMFVTPLSIIFSVLGAQLRDLKHIMTLVLQALFFLSPVMMTRVSLDTPELAILKYINPLVPLLDLFREPVLYGKMWTPESVITVCLWGAAFWVAAGVVSVRAGRKIVFIL
jgi:lipopolysaccharide transport system permease protein